MTLPPLPTTLTTARLMLRPWRPGDAEALRAALDASDAHLRPWVPFMRDEPRTLAATRELLAAYPLDPRAARYAVWGEGEVLLGEVLLMGHPSPATLEIGYWLHADHTGCGYAREAVAALVAVGLGCPGVAQVVFRCDVRNHASSAVAHALGAVLDHVAAEGHASDRVSLGHWVLTGLRRAR